MITAPQPPSPSHQPIHVLAIDDNLASLSLLRQQLQRRGFIVHSAPDGLSGLKSAAVNDPDIVLLDASMPGMDGYEVCRELRTIDRLREVPVLFLSGLDDAVDKLRAFASGAYDYVTKPYNVDEVAVRIETHVTIRRLRLDLQRQYQQLLESEHLRDLLTGLIAHDLRSPLAVIMATLDFSLQTCRASLDPAAARLIESALRQSHVMESMIANLLDARRLEGSQMPLHPGSHPIRSILQQASESVLLRDCLFEVQVTPGIEKVWCDPALIRRVITNLLDNAAKFSPKGRPIQLNVTTGPDQIRFEVHDFGPGIAPEHQSVIFDRFTQAQRGGANNGASFGLGLTFCRLAVEAHRGQIGVESRLGEGSLFWFTLPISPLLPAHDPENSAQVSSRPNLNQLAA